MTVIEKHEGGESQSRKNVKSTVLVPCAVAIGENQINWEKTRCSSVGTNTKVELSSLWKQFSKKAQ